MPPRSLLLILAAALISCAARAGTLDDAPFRVVLPDPAWRLEDSAAQPMGSGVAIVAAVTNSNALITSLVIKTDTPDHSGSALDQICAGITDSFANPSVKVLSQEDTTFLGFKARKFAYLITQGTKVAYNEAMVFLSDTAGWTIACTGPLDKKSQIQQAFTMYHKTQ